MEGTALVRLFGFGATLVHGDTLVWDRWRWLKRRLPLTRGQSILDVGCGSGSFTIGAARRGYAGVGLSWDKKNQAKAVARADLCRVQNVAFPICDVRNLDESEEYFGAFDFVLCLENIEHILDDKKLMVDMNNCLRPGGRLLLTAPNFYYQPISDGDKGPFLPMEDGGHVRRGYSRAMLEELCSKTNFLVEEVSSCGGFSSQKITCLMRQIQSPYWRFGLTLPLRLIPPMVDRAIQKLWRYPDFSICLVAYKPRWPTARHSEKADK